MQVAIIPALATLITRNSIRQAFRLLCNYANFLRDKFLETFMIFGAQSGW